MVKLVVQLQILPDTEQRSRLLATLERVNEAATFAARKAFESGVFSQASIHRLVYRDVRSTFGLSAQMAVRAIGKAVECFARDRKVCPVFKRHSAITYDERIMRFKGTDKVSLWALMEGRITTPLIYGQHQKQRFNHIRGQADLVYRKGRFFLYCTVNLPDSTPVQSTSFLGVDLGVVNIACTSDGRRYAGSQINSVRHRHRRLRTKLQKKGTRAAKRRLRSLSGSERRFATHVNHCISKQIVAEAERSGRGIAIEELGGIRERVKALQKQRVVLHSWAFSQLRLFLQYKSAMAGVVVVAVDPRNTSRTCAVCGYCAKENRRSQQLFRCRSCNYEAHADINAAVNIGRAARKPAELGELCSTSHCSVKKSSRSSDG